MVRELTCQDCLERIHEHSLGASHALEQASRFEPEVQGHLEGCPACRQACVSSLRLEQRLQQLSQDLPVPDMRAAVMLRLRQGQRAAYPSAPAAPRLLPRAQGAGRRELVLVLVALTCLCGLYWPGGAWIAEGLLGAAGVPQGWTDLAQLGASFKALFSVGWLAWPELAMPEAFTWLSWRPAWEGPLLLGGLALCAWQTYRWRQEAHHV